MLVCDRPCLRERQIRIGAECQSDDPVVASPRAGLERERLGALVGDAQFQPLASRVGDLQALSGVGLGAPDDRVSQWQYRHSGISWSRPKQPAPGLRGATKLPVSIGHYDKGLSTKR